LTSSKKTTKPSRTPAPGGSRAQADSGSRSAPRHQEPLVRLARIRRTQGRKGEVFADILTDFPEKFADRRNLWLVAADGPVQKAGGPGPSHLGTGDGIFSSPPREVELVHHWPHKGGIVLHFAGVDSISAAESLIGSFVAIPLTERAPLAADEVYIDDLIGCTLVDVAGPTPVDLGTIEDVDRTAGPTPLLVVGGAQGEILVPFANSYLRKIDLAAKRIEMALPEGLTGLNAPKDQSS
jgi:16S rRNA processing protein RimM